jgi:isoamylase
VSYNEKHNEANGEGNNDGESHNRSWNCGVEGPTNDPDIRDLRLRQQRNFLTTLLFSQGVPMMLHGDELGRTQGGNNNGYCQDNDISWIQWVLDEDDQKLLVFAQSLVKLRREHPVFRRRRFFAGNADHGGESELGDIAWFTPEAHHMDEEAWSNGLAKSLMIFLNGSAIPEPDPRGQQIFDDSFLVMFNAHPEPLTFTLPDEEYGAEWIPVIDTALHEVEANHLDPTWQIQVQPRSVVVLRCPREIVSPIIPGVTEEATA